MHKMGGPGLIELAAHTGLSQPGQTWSVGRGGADGDPTPAGRALQTQTTAPLSFSSPLPLSNQVQPMQPKAGVL